ncbi:MAG: hypothetical protein WBD47_19380 [Phormidesmis sp.]
MFNKLEELSLTLDFLTKNEADQIIESVNSSIQQLLNSHIIDVLWKEEGKNATILRPFSSTTNSRRGKAKACEIREDSIGIWAWVYQNKAPIWLENIKRTIELSEETIKNEISGKEVEVARLDMFEDTDSIMAFPLFFRDTLWGIYCIELPISSRLSLEVLEFLKRVSRPMARIVWKADAHELNDQQTTEAINNFKRAVEHYNFQQILNPYRTGFVARPFDRRFEDIYDCIVKYLAENEIQVQQYTHRPGSDFVVSEIMEQVSQAQFGIADITGINPNVMLELGMMMVLRKKLILLRRHDDESVLPFDIKPYHCYEYEIHSQGIRIFNPSSSRPETLDSVLANFIKELYGDLSFAQAKPFLRRDIYR